MSASNGRSAGPDGRATVLEASKTSSHQVPPVPSALPARVKARRRPLLVGAMVGLVCLGALVSVWAYQSASDTHQVIALRSTVERGQVIGQSDLMEVTVGLDPVLDPVSAADASDVVGKRAALDLAAGSLLTMAGVTDEVLPAAGSSIVGVTLAPGLLPAEPLYAGDSVRLVTTPGMDGNASAVVEPTALNATVVGTQVDEQTGNTIVDVTLPAAQAAVLAARAATGKVSLVLDARER